MKAYSTRVELPKGLSKTLDCVCIKGTIDLVIDW